MKRKFIFYLTIIVLGILCMCILKYVHAKTLGEGDTDCMIVYVNEHFPNGCTYNIVLPNSGKNLPHIDKCGLENEYMVLTGKVNGCFVGGSPMVTLFNTPYCFITLILEK